MRFITVQGGKGGIGKTVAAQGIATYLDEHKISWRGADTDQENKVFAAVYPGKVAPFTLYDPESGRLQMGQVNAFVDAAVKALEDGVEVYLVDQGAGQLAALRGALAETGFLGMVGKDVAMTVAYVIVNSDASLSTLSSNKDAFEGVAADWLVVKNLVKGPITKYDQGTVLRPALMSAGAKEAVIPQITDDTVADAWEKSGSNLTDFADKVGSWSERGRMKTWRSAVLESLAGVDALLRNPTKATGGPRKAATATTEA